MEKTKTTMTQERINKYFESGLGQQLEELYSTSDDRVFIRLEEAHKHVDGLLDPGTKPLENKEVIWWCREETQEFQVNVTVFTQVENTNKDAVYNAIVELIEAHKEEMEKLITTYTDRRLQFTETTYIHTHKSQ